MSHRTRRLVLLVAVASLVIGQLGAIAAQETPAPDAAATPDPVSMPPSRPQPSFDVLRLTLDNTALPYRIWHTWMPVVVTTPDGGGWTFFSAQARTPDGFGDRRLYASRFNPERQLWLPAEPLPGGAIQFGPAAVVDAAGTVHLVYADRASDAPEEFSTLVYTRTNETGEWEPPVPVAPHPDAGHQMMPSLALDGDGQLHLVWRDQRDIDPEKREALPSNADLFASDWSDGAWSEPVLVADWPSADLNPGWPQLVADGERLVAVWSLYEGTTAEEMETPIRVEWSARPVDDPVAWSRAATLIDQGDGNFGGQLLDLAARPAGGVVLVYDRVEQATNHLFLRRLDQDAATWSDPVQLTDADFGYIPSMAIAEDGTAYVVFNIGRGRNVQVGAMAIPDETDIPVAPFTVTPAEDGLQARAAIALAADGSPWIVYMHQAAGSSAATQIRALRGLNVED